MYFLYSFLLAAGVAVLLPRFLWDAARHGKYAAGLRERAGSLPGFDAEGRPVVWLHCVSVGETQAARPLARAILEEYPGHALVVSTTTQTGQRVAREVFGHQAALVFYFPFDWAWSVRRALAAVNPSAVLVMETELWPRFFRECRRRGVPVALVNGRISEKSFGRYSLIRFFTRKILADLSLAVMQTEEDAGRIRSLGLAPERVRVSGNVKFDMEAAGGQTLTEELRRRFGFDDAGRPLVVAASTHAPEEAVVLEAFKRLAASSGGARPRLLVAPRHPERFAEVASLLDSSGLTWACRSEAARESDAGCDAVLLDSIGELRAVYPLADLVFVGGSIAPVGGHNVLEPALDARCVVTGPHTSNFTAVVNALLKQGALVQLDAVGDGEMPDALASTFARLLKDDEERKTVGARAREAVEQNRGATARTVKMLAPILNEKSDGRSQLSVKGRTLTSDI
ncbi:MAG TPA: 3-deoxy-D-manno-octulosonic acid transferase [Pyrinomonadaceae bacterium]|jgi:3-deoxy-D-manno-octulosonic-acid transferase|nr:3-deoxy-D-manno-octulosonic acid transferase [Pyrinomonadaceae bacterium]